MSTHAAELGTITVLDLAGIGPAPRCVRLLADLGARWIRLTPPAAAARIQPRWYHYGGSRGVEQFEIDLKSARDVFLRLAAQADVVVESFRPGVAARLGIGYESVREVNPRIVYCSLTGYGQTGPYAQHAGHDLNYQARAGALAAIGRRADGTPAIPGLTLADSAGGGWQAALRIMAALVQRDVTGAGKYLDVSASEGVLHLMAVALDEYLATGTAAAPGHTMVTGRYAFYDLYGTADGGAMAVAAIEPKFFANLCHALERPELVERQFDDAAQPAIRAAFAAAFVTRTRAEWSKVFDCIDACVCAVLSVEETVDDAHWQALGMFAEYDHPGRGHIRQVRPFGGRPANERGDAPVEGGTTPEAVLASFGFSDPEIKALKARGTLR